MQPQRAQSGVPPNWHGVIRFSRSAEMHSVVCAKMQASGEDGGVGQGVDQALGHLQLGIAGAQLVQRGDGAARSSAVRHSGDSSPTCGV